MESKYEKYSGSEGYGSTAIQTQGAYKCIDRHGPTFTPDDYGDYWILSGICRCTE